MSEFRRDGLIETRERKETFILDRKTLSQLASGPSDSSADCQIRI